MKVFHSYSRRSLLPAAAIAASLLLVLFTAWFLCGRSAKLENTAPFSAVPRGQSGKTAEDRLQFADLLGIRVDSSTEEADEILIPGEFDAIYQQYNALQERQGLSLTRYRGKKCTRYTYRVENHPDTKAEVRLNLIVYRGKIIGGDLCSLGLDAFQVSLLSLQTNSLPVLLDANLPLVRV